ncbi:6-phosphogluconolactonase [Meiothermus sp.]|uniref:6-phosphogluconolactonase n=1 Tax=Meiothermus sp. TaxID=1955249 RepID=UPI0021DC997F|nr:6-phosphogluconolactonase [Meiothermus sp.]GIW35199.1 MAG: 6-phosphogluconolactonase [Meiothermus sp.]
MGFSVQVSPTPEAVAEALSDKLAQQLRHGGRAVLAGGQTPLPAYEQLGRCALPWEKIELVPSDERCVAPESPLRNDRQIGRALGLEQVCLHRFPVEQGSVAAALQMEPVVARMLPFTTVVLGLGEDGHTASLFPGLPIPAKALVAPVLRAPKPPPERVTLTPLALAQTELLVLVAVGLSKREALRRVLAGEALPPNQIKAPQRIVFCDHAAYPDS